MIWMTCITEIVCGEARNKQGAKHALSLKDGIWRLPMVSQAKL